MNNKIHLRAHHGLCLYFFRGKGYNDKFVKKMKRIQYHLKTNPQEEVIIIKHADCICQNCPNRIANHCENECFIQKLDGGVLDACNLEENTNIRWDEFQSVIKSEILLKDKLKNICKGCQWYYICSKLL